MLKSGDVAGEQYTLPPVLYGVPSIEPGDICLPTDPEAAEAVKRQFPGVYALPLLRFEQNRAPRVIGKQLRIGVVLGGGSAPGAVELIVGLHSYLKRWNRTSVLLGFKGGLSGILQDDTVELDDVAMEYMQMEGGMSVMGSGVAGIGSLKGLARAADVCRRHRLNGLAVIGGTRGRMTDIVRLAQHFEQTKLGVSVVAVPKRAEGLTMGEGDDEITVSFGFDSIAKLYSMLVSNLHKDVQSAKASYHFVRLMGDENGSFMTLEAALHTHPNVVLIGEEVSKNDWGLMDLIGQICDVLCARAQQHKNYGIILMPEGILYSITEMNSLLEEINSLVADAFQTGTHAPSRNDILSGLTDSSCRLALRLPPWFLDQMIWQRNVLREVRMANVQVEKLFALLVGSELELRKRKGRYVGKYAYQTHFFGYEARNQHSSPFDSQLGFTLGHAAGAVIEAGHNGYSVSIKGLSNKVPDWTPVGTPLTSMMTLEKGHPIVRFGKVSLESYAFKALQLLRRSWVEDRYRPSVGPLSETQCLCLQMNDLQRKHNQEGELKRHQDKMQELYQFIQNAVNEPSEFTRLRMQYEPPVPSCLRGACTLQRDDPESHRDGKMLDPGAAESLKQLFPATFDTRKVYTVKGNTSAGGISTGHPFRVGIIFSGGPAPGGHNVIAGLYDFLKDRNQDSVLLGFLDGPDGLLRGRFRKISGHDLAEVRNQGGFTLIGTSRVKIETEAQMQRTAATVKQHGLNSLVICGGDDSNTNAALLADYFTRESVPCQVIGIPKTIDADLRSDAVEMSFGFDTTAKTYSALIANVMHEVQVRRDRWHFIRLMGRSASHITLECALQTHPNYTCVLEEVAQKGTTVLQIAQEVTDLVVRRAAQGKDFGVVLIPEGLIEVTKDMKSLVAELNELMARGVRPERVHSELSKESAATFNILPTWIRTQLMSERDPHGNVRVSLIESERLVASLVAQELQRREDSKKTVFHYWCHFFGYQGRCALTSNFDCNFCYVLGHLAGALTAGGATGVIGAVRNMEKPVEEWELLGVPLISMMTIERRKGKNKPVIRKKLVELDGPVFQEFQKSRAEWSMLDSYPSRSTLRHLLGVFDQLPTQTLLLEKGHSLSEASAVRLPMPAPKL
eukprot:TRINITY_DN343_c0_g1_i2.p1 TRINITY_DN343_c0_g1~~TRINITY_DN343_c0_g1_i2.p1  ORF type:complete len:1158 (+),score=465.27 TRINITY_DN343_c0_g1_i2:89-3475(+)